VSRLGLGTYQLTTDRGVTRAEAIAIIRRAGALGISLVDTAPLYGGGEAETLVGIGLKGRADVRIVDKVGRFEGTGLRAVAEHAYGDAAIIRAQFDQSLAALRREFVDLLLIHETDWARWWPGGWGVGPVMDVLFQLRKEGLVERIGLSVRSIDETEILARTGHFDAVLFVHHFNAVWQEDGKRLIDVCAAHDMGLAIGAPFRQGLLIGDDPNTNVLSPAKKALLTPGALARVEKVRSIAREAGLSLGEVALRFFLQNDYPHTIFVGPRSVDELEENVTWIQSGPLPPDVRRELESVVLIPMEQPVKSASTL